MSLAWRLRLCFAVLLLFGSEILLWNNPVEHSPLDWVVLSLGCVVCSAIVLDFATRYKVRDLMGLMTLAGVYGLLNALLLNPQIALADISHTFIIRVTGAPALLGLEMLLFFLACIVPSIANQRRLMLAGAGVVGLAWGTWARYAPSNSTLAFETPSLEAILIVAGGFLLLILAQIALIYRASSRPSPQTAESLVLSPQETVTIGAIFAALMLLRLIQGTFDLTALFLAVIIFALCYAILWFRRGTKHPPIVSHTLIITPLPLYWIIASMVILLLSGAIAYQMPVIGTPDFNQLTIIIYGFMLYGLAWLPTVSLLIGMRAYVRQIQAKPL